MVFGSTSAVFGQNKNSSNSKFEKTRTVNLDGARKTTTNKEKKPKGKPIPTPTPTPIPTPIPTGTPTTVPTLTPTPVPTPISTPNPTPTPNQIPTPLPFQAQWEIAATAGVKIYTNVDAWHYVSASQLQGAGFDVSGNSDNWQLYVDGRQVPIKVNPDGSIEFYGNGIDEVDTDSKVFYLINSTNPGLRITNIYQSNSVIIPDALNFSFKVVNNTKHYYYSNLLNGEESNWFGAFLASGPVSENILVQNLGQNGQATLTVKLQGMTYFNHLINVKINNFDLGTVSYANQDNYEHSFNVPLSILTNGDNQITFQAVGGSSDYNFIDSISLDYPRQYKAVNDELRFLVMAGEAIIVEGFTNSNISLFEVVNGKVSNQLIVESRTIDGTNGFGINASGFDREFIAYANNQYSTPIKVEPNTPSEWNKSYNQGQYIIITPEAFASSANQLAQRREGQGLSTRVVLAEDVADEFGFGILTPQSIRDFLQHAVSNWSVSPDYVLLFADSSFDPRNYLNTPERELIPTKAIETFDMETSSDGWMVDFDNNNVEDIAIGRLPAGNLTEANKMISKIIRYETENTNDPQKALLTADTYFEILNGELQNLLPNNVNSDRVERSSMTDSQMRQEILDKANNNPTVVTYLGHGTPNVWSTGSVFGVNQAPTLTNQKLSFYMLMTCLNGYTHNPTSTSLAESLLMSNNGAIAVWASSGSTYASGQIAMGQNVVDELFPSNGGNLLRIGDIVKQAKSLSSDADARRTWQLYGDPTLTIQ
jgi:hypothetical protein